MLRVIRILILFVVLLIAIPIAMEAQAASPKIDVLTVKGTINPVLGFRIADMGLPIRSFGIL